MTRWSVPGRGWIGAVPVACLLSAMVLPPGSSAAAAAVLDCGPARVLTAVADAWIDESSPSTNLGGDPILKVRSQGPNGNFRALVRFPTPEACVLQSAKLRLYAAAPGEDGVWTPSAWPPHGRSRR